MKQDCECTYCKNQVNEYFCGICGYNFNECESFHEFDGMILCPKCHPKNCPFMIKYEPTETDKKNNKKYNIFLKYVSNVG